MSLCDGERKKGMESKRKGRALEREKEVDGE